MLISVPEHVVELVGGRLQRCLGIGPFVEDDESGHEVAVAHAHPGRLARASRIGPTGPQTCLSACNWHEAYDLQDIGSCLLIVCISRRLTVYNM